VVIGAKLSDALIDRLEACCLTDEEMELGPEGWLSLEDPFPAWRIVESDEEFEEGQVSEKTENRR
jgi:hypothetical protein